MQTITSGADRLTVSLPKSLSLEIDAVRKELNVPKSEIFRLAMQQFLEQYQKEKLRKAAEMMAAEYESDDELTALTALDAEDFK